MDSENKNIDNIDLLIRYFADEVSPSERTKLEHWRNEQEANRKEFIAFEKLWNLTGNITDKEIIDVEKEWKKINRIITPQKTKIITLRRVLQIAASIIIIFTFGLLAIKQTSTITQKSGIAQTSDIILPDGSVIKLNAHSTLSYNKGFGAKHREVTLKGEAYFKVSPDKQLPFIISARNTKIEVVGTEFNVNAYKNEVEVKVVVTQGKVKFYDMKKPGKEIILSGGESGVFIKEQSEIIKEPAQDLNDIAWITRKIDFRNTTLSDVGKILENTYHKEFEISPEMMNCTITVSFDNVELEPVLEVLKSTLNLEISLKKNKIFISGKGC